MMDGGRATQKTPDNLQEMSHLANPSISALPRVWVRVLPRDINEVTFLKIP